MYNILSKEGMQNMMGRGKILKALLVGFFAGFLSFVILFSNHPQFALYTTGLVIVFLIFGPDSKKKEAEKTKTYTLNTESSNIAAQQELPPYSRVVLKHQSKDALFDINVARAIREAEEGETIHLIWNIDKNHVKTKWSISKKRPSQTNIDGLEVPTRKIIEKLFA